MAYSSIIVPPLLNCNDKAIIISPAGCVDTSDIYKAGEVLAGWGLSVDFSRFCEGKNGRFSGTVDERAFDLQSAMDDSNIKLIFCSRGGYGIVHLLEQLNFDKILKSPKWLVGYSDVTALHSLFLKHGLISVHAPMANHLASYGENFSVESLRKLLFEGEVDYLIPNNSSISRPGDSSGTLFGGNLAVLSSILCSDYITIPEDGILFIEDIAEPAYKIDRMMWSLRLSGVLSKIRGIIVGQFTACDEDAGMYDSIRDSILSVVAPFDFPVAFDFPIGHTADNYPVLSGAQAHLSVTTDYVRLHQKIVD